MPKTTFADDKARISAAVLNLAVKGWGCVTLDAVAKKAKIPSATLKKRFKAPVDLIPIIVKEIDRAASATTGKTTGTPHDVLFDLLMTRFDAMQKNRDAILNIAGAALQDRRLSRALACATMDSIYRLIEAGRLSALPRPVLAVGLIAVYGFAFCAWRKDESRDMAKTMAALDRGLRWAANAAGIFVR